MREVSEFVRGEPEEGRRHEQQEDEGARRHGTGGAIEALVAAVALTSPQP